ncbi:MAG TPA: Hsp70 family protein, partial [Duganella sp.]
NSGLTEAEIRKMVQDAAAHAEDDRRAKALAEARNAADALLHTTRKALQEHGGKLGAPERERIDGAIAALDGALKGNDQADIEAKTAALSTASQKLGEQMYGGANAAANNGGAGTGQGAGADGGANKAANDERHDDVVDAEFKEVRK